MRAAAVASELSRPRRPLVLSEPMLPLVLPLMVPLVLPGDVVELGLRAGSVVLLLIPGLVVLPLAEPVVPAVPVLPLVLPGEVVDVAPLVVLPLVEPLLVELLVSLLVVPVVPLVLLGLVVLEPLVVEPGLVVPVPGALAALGPGPGPVAPGVPGVVDWAIAMPPIDKTAAEAAATNAASLNLVMMSLSWS